ncbi:MAG: GNAT family N-acetyltransferase [Patescibacteria group bacterium]
MNARELSSGMLRERFGDLRFEVLFQDVKNGIRVSCIRRGVDDSPLACSVVRFTPSGVVALGAYHDRILQGALIGETIAGSGKRYRRSVSANKAIPTTYATKFLFGVEATRLRSRIVEYTVDGLLYCRIREMYNPCLFPVGRCKTAELETDASVAFIIAPLRPADGDDYLRLAHGFLQKDMHVGIKDQEEFVLATRGTLNLLLDDPNTHLFVAANAERVCGYVALNIHPALHLNGLECVIRELYVSNNSRRRGLASALVTYVKQFAHRRGCKRLSLATNWADDVQRNFYEANGFERRCDFATKPL